MIAAATMIRVIERREQKLRLAMSSLAQTIAARRDGLATLEGTIAAVERRACANASSRFSTGSRSVGELLEIEQNSSSLRAGRAELETLRGQSNEALARLTDRQQALLKEWRKEDVRLAHITAIARRARLLAAARQFDADE